jgi:hypothetical protein
MIVSPLSEFCFLALSFILWSSGTAVAVGKARTINPHNLAIHHNAEEKKLTIHISARPGAAPSVGEEALVDHLPRLAPHLLLHRRAPILAHFGGGCGAATTAASPTSRESETVTVAALQKSRENGRARGRRLGLARGCGAGA